MTDSLRVSPPASVAGCNEIHTKLEAATARLAEAVADYDRALDRRAVMAELQVLDRAVSGAQRELDAAARDDAATVCGHRYHRPSGDESRSQAAG